MSIFRRRLKCRHNTVRFHTITSYVGQYDVTLVGFCVVCAHKVEQRVKGVPYRSEDTNRPLVTKAMTALGWRYRGEDIWCRTDASRPPVFLDSADRELLLTCIHLLPEPDRARLTEILSEGVDA